MTPKIKPRTGGNRPEVSKKNSLISVKNLDVKVGKVKDSLCFAAVYQDRDPRAANAPRVVPNDASPVTIGNLVLGYWHQPKNPSRLPKSWKMVMVKQRYNELARIVKYRRAYDLDPGPPIGWAVVLADLEAAFGREVNVASVRDLCRRLKLPLIDDDVVAGVAHTAEMARRVWTSYRPITAASVGALLLVTTVEREECQLKRIDAIDEPSDARRRRLSKERMKRKRERDKALRAHT